MHEPCDERDHRQIRYVHISGPATVVINRTPRSALMPRARPVVDHTGELGEFPGCPDDQLHDGHEALWSTLRARRLVQPRRRRAPDRLCAVRVRSGSSARQRSAPALATEDAARALGLPSQWLLACAASVNACPRRAPPARSAHTLNRRPDSCTCSGRAIPDALFTVPPPIDVEQVNRSGTIGQRAAPFA